MQSEQCNLLGVDPFVSCTIHTDFHGLYMSSCDTIINNTLDTRLIINRHNKLPIEQKNVQYQ